ncbi:MAG: drug/metabolite exporter YedA [Polyangiaceae bacterium]|nr:drug/metabolite exporter YedA [Polyangiaceae bacterium]
MPLQRRAWLVPLCLFILYTVWGSTYLAQRIALASFAPLSMAGVRFVISGALLYGFMRLRGAAAPTRAEWRNVVVSGVPLIVTGMGAAAVGMQRVPSGLTALLFGSVPLWASFIDWLWGGRLRKFEVAGLVVGLAGVTLVSVEGGLDGDPLGALTVLGAAASYALGCVSTRRLAIPKGAMGPAAQMLAGGVLLLIASVATGERMPTPTGPTILALVHLIVLGSLAAYTALGYLLKNARPALATSYAFVNPIVALGLGAWLAGEQFGVADIAGLGLVLLAVALVAAGARDAKKRAVDVEPGGVGNDAVVSVAPAQVSRG